MAFYTATGNYLIQEILILIFTCANLHIFRTFTVCSWVLWGRFPSPTMPWDPVILAQNLIQCHLKFIRPLSLLTICWQQLYIRSHWGLLIVSKYRKGLFGKWTVKGQSAFCSINHWDILYRFLLHFILDGSDIIRQWCQFNMGALSSGPGLCDEWKTQSQPSGQTAVSFYCCEMFM